MKRNLSWFEVNILRLNKSDSPAQRVRKVMLIYMLAPPIGATAATLLAKHFGIVS